MKKTISLFIVMMLSISSIWASSVIVKITEFGNSTRIQVTHSSSAKSASSVAQSEMRKILRAKKVVQHEIEQDSAAGKSPQGFVHILQFELKVP